MPYAPFHLSFWSKPLIFFAVMGRFKRFKNQTFAKVYTKIPSLVDLYAKHAELIVNTTAPFTPLKKPLEDCQLTLVTTGGIHAKDQKPFNMTDKKAIRPTVSFLQISPLTN